MTNQQRSSSLHQVGHLARRLWGSLSSAAPSADDELWAESWLQISERRLWRSMSNADRRHAVVVARRFADLRDGGESTSERAEMAAALLHDVGKVPCGMGTGMRIVATIVGPRTSTFRAYHDHEAIGLDMMLAAGSEPESMDLLRGIRPHSALLRAADQV